MAVDVPATNNISECEIRPSVVFRKVTNGFRSDWGAQIHADTAPSPGPPASAANLRSRLCATLSMVSSPSPDQVTARHPREQLPPGKRDQAGRAAAVHLDPAAIEWPCLPNLFQPAERSVSGTGFSNTDGLPRSF